MAKQIVVAVMVIDSDNLDEKFEYCETIGLDMKDPMASLPAVQQWVSEQVVSAKVTIIKNQ